MKSWRVPATLVATAIVFGACATDRPTSSDLSRSAANAADALAQMADSARKAGDSVNAIPLGLAADIIRRTHQVSLIKINVNGAPVEFHAVAQRIEITGDGCGTPTPLPPPDSSSPGLPPRTGSAGADTGVTVPPVLPPEPWPMPPPECGLRDAPNLIAWAGDRPRLVLFIHADTGSSVFGFPPAPPPSPPPGGDTTGAAPIVSTSVDSTPPFRIAYAVLFNRDGWFWMATQGGVIDDVKGTDRSCFNTDQPGVSFADIMPRFKCQLAEFHWAFRMKLEPVQTMGPRPGAEGNVTLSMEKQAVLGVILSVRVEIPPGPPPDSARPLMRGSLGTRLDTAGAHFRFQVSNLGRGVAEAHFPTSQRFDIQVMDPTGKTVWVWSATRDFMTVLGVETVEPGGSRVYEGLWEKPAPGRYLAFARWTSRDFPVVAADTFDIR
jgi:hypothetical protein